MQNSLVTFKDKGNHEMEVNNLLNRSRLTLGKKCRSIEL